MKSTRKSRERENPGLSHDNLCGVNERELGKGCEECGEIYGGTRASMSCDKNPSRRDVLKKEVAS